MRLAVFDIDGTLARTVGLDDRCYLSAFELEFGFRPEESDWSAYEHTTDSWIATEILRRRWGREPEPEAIDRHRRRFVALLDEARRESPDGFRQVPGAGTLLEAIARRPDWRAALATGAWLESARLKLAAAGIPWDGLPLATNEDGATREEIVTAAIERARSLAGGLERDFEKIVSVGDGVWDVRAARRLGLAFVGVGEGRGARALEAAGAGTVLADLTDPESVLAALEAAEAPA